MTALVVMSALDIVIDVLVSRDEIDALDGRDKLHVVVPHRLERAL